ncbi:MAG: extracellular solute-binding protein [Desulfobulbaceae bacterium]|nr:extracellular solute-binding protein [Desulfobulbaceae bacterium]
MIFPRSISLSGKSAVWVLTFALIIIILSRYTGAKSEEVVIYTSVDQVFSEPILDRFERRSGIKVRAVFDVEAAKTVGLINRLLAERKRPRADVFWNSEVSRTITLQNKNVLQPYFSLQRQNIPSVFKDNDGYWTGFACRARVFIYNTNMLKKEEVPSSMLDLIQPEWQGRFTMAYPLLGTAATHMGALYSHLGKEKVEEYLKKLEQNKVLIVAGNSVVRDVVAAGQVPLGLTDTDDVLVAMARNKPVDMIFPDQEGMGTFMIPNTVAMIKDCPHPEQAKILIDFLLSPEVESLLARSESANLPVRESVQHPGNIPPMKALKVLQIDYKDVATYVPISDNFNRRLFSY